MERRHPMSVSIQYCHYWVSYSRHLWFQREFQLSTRCFHSVKVRHVCFVVVSFLFITAHRQFSFYRQVADNCWETILFFFNFHSFSLSLQPSSMSWELALDYHHKITCCWSKEFQAAWLVSRTLVVQAVLRSVLVVLVMQWSTWNQRHRHLSLQPTCCKLNESYSGGIYSQIST